MTTDPVCKMQVNVGSNTPSVDYADEYYYFCSQHCLEKFRANPTEYIQPVVTNTDPEVAALKPAHEQHSLQQPVISARIGVVLSSGGARGIYAHTGFLLTLQNLGIEASAIAGCSAGAIVGGMAASGTDLHQWSAAIANVQEREYWTPDSWSQLIWQVMVKKGRGYSGLSDTEAAVAFCRRNLAVQTFAQCQIPFYSLALDLDHGAKVLFSDGELAPRMMASAAMPLLYRPINIEGKWYADGAVIDLAPTDAICCKHHLDALIVHHTSVRCESRAGVVSAMNQPWSLLKILQLSIYHQRPWYLSDQPLAFHTCRCGCGALIVVLEPELPESTWPLHTGGHHIQAAVMSQTLAKLQPYVETLIRNPKQLLPSQTGAGTSNTNGCATR